MIMMMNVLILCVGSVVLVTNFEKIHALEPVELASWLSEKFGVTDEMEKYFCKQCFVKHGYCRWEDSNEEQCMYDQESMIFDFLMEECSQAYH